MKDKRSFFERLTGTVRVEDELPEEEDVVPARKDSFHSRQKIQVQDREPELSSRDTEWANEEPEGQLTVDVYQTPDDIIIRTLVAGVDPNDLDISITRDLVTIKGKRDGVTEVSENDYFYQELYWGSFVRSIALPEEIDVEESEASQKHGLLTIRLPKIDKSRQTKLKVKAV